LRRRTGPRPETRIYSADARAERSESQGFPAVSTGSSRAEIHGSESKLITRGAMIPSGRILCRRRRGVRGGQTTCRLIELQGVGDCDALKKIRAKSMGVSNRPYERKTNQRALGTMVNTDWRHEARKLSVLGGRCVALASERYESSDKVSRDNRKCSR
jgi:hypothetical protein